MDRSTIAKASRDVRERENLGAISPLSFSEYFTRRKENPEVFPSFPYAREGKFSTIFPFPQGENLGVFFLSVHRGKNSKITEFFTGKENATPLQGVF